VDIAQLVMSSSSNFVGYASVSWIQPDDKLTQVRGEYMNLYEVVLVNGGDRNDIQIINGGQIVAIDEEQAKMKSGVMAQIDESWDMDYVTIICRNIGRCMVEEKPIKVKQK